jgi:hypothetical protein
MKNLIKVSAILFALLLTVFSCQKKNPSLSENANLQRLNKNESGHPADSNDFGDDDMVYFEDLISGDLNNLNNTFYTPSNIQFTVSLDSTNDTTIVLTKKMMEFSDTTTLFNAIGIMEYQFDSILDEWEITNSFTSLRRSYNDYVFASREDIENKRPFMEPTMESMANEDKCFKVGDLVFIYLLNQDKEIIYNILTSNADIFDINTQSSVNCLLGSNKNKYYCYLSENDMPYDCYYESGNYLMVCTKFNWSDLSIAKIGLKIELFEYNYVNNSWDRPSTKNLHMRKDQWHVVEWRDDWTSSNVNVWNTNKWINISNNPNKKAKRLIYVIDSKFGLFPKPYCLESFERVHFWPFIYNYDYHFEDYQ